MNNNHDTSSANLEECTSHVNDERTVDAQVNTKNSNLIIKDFGDILFAENDRRSKYVRIPFKPPSDDSTTTAPSLFPIPEPSESFDKTDMKRKLPSIDHIENKTKPKTLAENIVHMMRFEWKLPSPQLVISVNGGASHYKLPTPRARYAFQRGLIAAAVTTDAWIITAGNYTGVMKEVGDAVDKRRYKNTKTPSKVQCIGIGSWYYATGHEYLIQHHDSSSKSSLDSIHRTSRFSFRRLTSAFVSQHDDHTTKCVSSVLPYNPRKTSKHENTSAERSIKIYRSRTPRSDEDSCPLDPNHTHFILLDDMLGENIDSTSININCRADLTIELRTEIVHAINKSYAVPVVQILANGGPSSILTVCRALQQGTPVIVIEGTGRGADMIAREYRYLYEDVSKKDGEQRSIEIYKEASSKFEAFAKKIQEASRSNTVPNDAVLNHTNCDQFIQQLTSRKGYFLISIYQFHDDQGGQKLDDAILHALFNAAKILPNKEEQRTTELKLAMAWNKFDRIHQSILTDKTIVQWTGLELDQALCDSLRMNKIRCIDLLVEYGASFDRLQALDILDQLYQDMETNILPYSPRMIKKIRKKTKLSDWTKPDKKYFYEDYLDMDLNKQNLSLCQVNNSITKYGILYDDTVSTNSTSHIKGSICVFNALDMIQVNGYLSTISIRFDKSKPFSSNNPPVCYIISPTNNPNLFLIASKCHLRSSSNNSRNVCHYKTAEKRLFVTNGQYLAIGFTDQTGFPSHVSHRNQHSLDLNRIEHEYSILPKTPIQFNVETTQGVSISFNIEPSPEFFRDLFFWSLFFNRYDMATYLCSISPNTTIAALMASKIYHQAAKFTVKSEKRLEFIKKKEKFEKHASRILDRCFDENDEFALKILTKPSPLFFSKNPLQIAEDIESRTFLASTTVQHYLDEQWYGQINIYHHNHAWIAILIFIICFIPILIPIQALSKFIVSDKRQPKAWEKKPHVIGWSARIFYRFKEFYYDRAIVQFYYNIVFYFFFLTLFSYILLVNYFPINLNRSERSGYQNFFLPVSEIFLHILIWGLIFEEISEFIKRWKEKKKNHSRYNIWNHFTQNQWNMLDSIAMLIYLIGFITRFIVLEEAFIVSKILMSIDLFLWYMRLLHVFAAFKRFGPKLLMIFNTMKDLLFFICFILIFLVAHSVTSYALIITKHQVFWEKSQNQSLSREFKILNNGNNLWNWRILRDITNWGLWKIFGQVDLEAVYHFDDEIRVTVDNDAYGTTALILTIVFVSVANILLLNVLVALLNVTIEKVQVSAYQSWAYHRFLLVMEYNKKTILPPPFNIFTHIFHPLYCFIRNYFSKRTHDAYDIYDNNEKMKIDSNLFDMVVFNGTDRIRQTGLLTSVTINFSSPPRISNPSITLYLLRNENDNPNMFFVDGEWELPTDGIQQGQTGVQTISLDEPIECLEKQFVALAFTKDSGTPVSVKDRNEHSVNLTHFWNLKTKKRSIDFINYSNKGAAFSFIVRPAKGRNNRTSTSETQTRSLETVTVMEQTDFEKSDLLNEPILDTSEELSSSTVKKSSSSTVPTQNKFDERDNMLRESSIAEDYWKPIIDKIKRQEKKIDKEQDDTINSSSSSESSVD